MLGGVNTREWTPQQGAFPEGSAREGVRLPARPLQAENTPGRLLPHLPPTTTPSWTRSASPSLVAPQQSQSSFGHLPTINFPATETAPVTRQGVKLWRYLQALHLLLSLSEKSFYSRLETIYIKGNFHTIISLQSNSEKHFQAIFVINM